MDVSLLEKPCVRCEAMSKQNNDDPHGPKCRYCNGRGKVPTEAGEALLAFIAHNMGRRTSMGYSGREVDWQGELFEPVRDVLRESLSVE